MYKILEVVGRSPEGFSEAVKTAVSKVIESGQKAHYFEVIEQRGLIKDSQLKEYQVIIKVAVDA